MFYTRVVVTCIQPERNEKLVAARKPLEQPIERARALIEQQSTLTNARIHRQELQDRIREFEVRYRLRSEDVPAAIGRGELDETLEVCDWMIDFDLLQRLNG